MAVSTMCKASTLLVCFAFLPLASDAQTGGSKPELVVATGHAGRVAAMAFSPDGRLLASGSGADSTIRLWELDTGQELRVLRGHRFGITSLAFSGDSRTLVSASSDCAIKLWDVVSGRELRTITTYRRDASAVAFSSDGKMLATAGDDSADLWATGSWLKLRTFPGIGPQVIAFSPDSALLATSGLAGAFDYGNPDRARWGIKLWETRTGQQRLALPLQASRIWSLAFSPDGKTLAAGGAGLKLLNPATGQEVRAVANIDEPVETAAFSPDGRLLAWAGRGDLVHISDSATGREIRTVEGAHTDFTNSIAFSPGGTLLASVSNRATDAVMLWDAKTWKALGILSGYDRPFLAAAFGPGGGLRAAAGEGRTIELWDVAGKSVHTWDGESQYLDTARFSNDGRTLVTVGRDDAVKAWNADTGQATPLGARTGNSDSLALSADGQLVATESADDPKKVELWDVATGRALHTLQHTANVGALAFSGDGRLLAVGAEGPGVALWDTATGRAIRTVGAEINEYSALALSADGRLLASSAGGEIALWDSSNGSKLRTLAGHDDDVRAMAFSPDVRLLASVSSDRTVKLWDIASGRELHSMSAGNDLNFVRFSPDGRLLAAMEWTGTLLLFDVAKGRELATVVRLVDRDWAAVDPEGRFDASPAGMDMMHWTVGTETISLNQLKDRYYEPGLVGKLLGSNREPLRNVAGFTDVKMFPEIEAVNAPADGRTLELQLKNRGGGIGRVQVFVNGKEVAADARGPTVNANAADATLTVDLSGAHWKPGEDNDVRIVSWNGEGYLASRGVTLAWKAPGTPETAPPELYAIVSGISEYASADFRLHFAAKDAEDFGRALEVAGTRLFGKERVHLTLLTSGDGAGKPTKENLAKAFAAARRSKPGDILVVYLAGHGVAVRDTYAYPTEEARTLELTDPAIRQQTAVTSEELVTWIKAIPALHQVMILDTCAAGAAQRSLGEKRDLPSDQIRAIDRLKDRTGFYVLMGSAADAASYEASQFGQGLLTYSLLQGMRGAALRDNKYVDVSRLFEYAADEVPQLARNIGGVQRPLIAAPQAGASFDIGELETADKAAIPLAVVKPIILRPVLINPAEGVDNLGLMQALRTKLRDESYVGARGNGDAPAVFVDEEEFPGAVRPTGTYTVEAGQVKVRLVLSRNGQKIGEAQVAGADGDRETLVNRMVDAILKGAR